MAGGTFSKRSFSPVVVLVCVILLAISEDIFDLHNWGRGWGEEREEMLLASSGMLLNILQYTGHPPHTHPNQA